MSDKISSAELFDKLATITAEDANDMKAKIYAVIQEMPTDPEPWEDIDWTELHDNLSRGMAQMNLAIRSASAGMAESIRTAITLREPKRGKWIEHEHGFWTFVNDKGERDGWIPDYECNLCGSRAWKYETNFCPNCGARMKGTDCATCRHGDTWEAECRACDNYSNYEPRKENPQADMREREAGQ